MAGSTVRHQLEEAVMRPSADFLRSQRLMRHDSVSLAGRPDLGAANAAGGHVAARDRVVGVLHGDDEAKLLHFKTGQALAFEFQRRRQQQAEDPADIELAQRLQSELDAETQADEARRRAREAMGDSDFARSLMMQEEAEQHNSSRALEDADAALALSLMENEGGHTAPPPAALAAAPSGLDDLSPEEIAQLIAAGALDSAPPTPVTASPRPTPVTASPVTASPRPTPVTASPRPTPQRSWDLRASVTVCSFAMHASLSGSEISELDAGDGLLLPFDLLERLDSSSEAAFFEVVNPLLPLRQKYAGLAANKWPRDGHPDSVVFAPSHLLLSLGVEEGQQIDVTRLHMPPASRLLVSAIAGEKQPRNAQAALFDSLSRLHAVCVGDTLVLREGDGDVFETRVLAVEPESPAEIWSAASLQVCFLQQQAAAPRVDATALRLDEPLRSSASSSEYRYFVVHADDAALQRAGALRVSVQATHGDPDVYISQTSNEPTMTQHTWSASTTGGELVCIPVAHEAYRPGQPFYIGVIGYEGPADFEIVATAGSVEPPSGSSGAPAEPLPPGFVACLNCKAHIPAAQRNRHEIACLRAYWSCPQCRLVVRREEKDSHVHCSLCAVALSAKDLEKHTRISHSPIACRCGRQFTLEQLMIHQEFDCSPSQQQLPVQVPVGEVTYTSPHASPLPAAHPASPLPAPPPSRPPPAPPAAHPPPPPAQSTSWRKASLLVCPYCEETVIGGPADAENHIRSCPAAAAFL